MKKHIMIDKLLFVGLLLTCFAAFSQNKPRYTIGLANVTSTASTLEMDVTFTIDNPENLTRLSQLSVGINYETAILGEGTPCTAKNCGSWVYIGGKSIALKGLAATVNTVKAGYGHLRIVGLPLAYNSAILLENGTYTLGRYRFINAAPWAADVNARLWIQPDNQSNKTNTILSAFPVEGSRKMVAYSAASEKGTVLSLEYTSENPFYFIPNPKNKAGNSFSVVAYPNPFTGSFQLAINNAAETDIQVKVYDMLGKLVENRTLTLSEIENTVIGANYPSGIYNINILQQDNSQTMRIIKR